MKDLLQIGGFVLVFLLAGIFILNKLQDTDDVQSLAQPEVMRDETVLEGELNPSETTMDEVVTQEPQVSIKDNEPKNTTQNTEQITTFKNSLGIFTVQFPSAWDMNPSELGLSLMVNSYPLSNDGRAIIFSALTDKNEQMNTLLQKIQGEDVVIGKNKYEKYTHEYGEIYRLFIGVANERSTYLYIGVQGFSIQEKSVVSDILSSVTTDPSKASLIVQREDNRAIDANIKAKVMNFRASAEHFYDIGGSYQGLCDWRDQTTEAMYDFLLQEVSSEGWYCNSNPDAYLFSVDLPGGESFCVDSTGYAGTLTARQGGLQCW